MTVTLPHESDFLNAALSHDLVSFSASIPWDHETIISLAHRFKSRDKLFLLESAPSGANKMARFSFLGFDPLWLWESEGYQAKIEFANSVEHIQWEKPETGIRKFYEHFKDLKTCHLLPGSYRGPDPDAQQGAVGYMAYDNASQSEPSIGNVPPKALKIPEIFYFIPRNYFIFDQLTHGLVVTRYICTKGLTDQRELKSLWDEETMTFRQLIESLNQPCPLPPIAEKKPEAPEFKYTSSLSKEQFLNHARNCLEEIKKGEIFQIQIGRRISGHTEADPFDIFRNLRMLNPSPYMFFYKMNQHVILGSSPEMMVGVEGKQITHRPIAGTRKRTWNRLKDQKMRQELLDSEKERAEHVMLVDLSRNDVGRVSEAGTVRVHELMAVEEYSHVYHMVSEVRGTLSSEFDTADALISGFPNGTVSGAPKIKAMEIINRCEPVAREFYAGSLGLFAFNGDLKSTILIRSIHIADQIASTQASAGIVFDSEPELEWNETTHKMAACLTAIKNT